MRCCCSGRHARTQAALAGNYYEDIGLGACAGPACIPSVEASLNAANGGGPATVLEGCADAACASVDVGAVRAAAAAAGVKAIVLAMGIDGTLEGEGNDRMDIRLPGAQARSHLRRFPLRPVPT